MLCTSRHGYTPRAFTLLVALRKREKKLYTLIVCDRLLYGYKKGDIISYALRFSRL